MLKTWFTDVFRNVEDEARAHNDASRGFDWKPVVVLSSAAVILTVQNYVFRSQHLSIVADLVRAAGVHEWADWFDGPSATPANRELAGLIYWASGRILTYLLVPALIVRWGFGERSIDYGLKLKGVFRGGWAYLGMFAFMLPWLVVVSATDRFQEAYPFYNPAADEPLWPRFIGWEAFYILQFVGLEFFFRGFILHGCRPRMGFYSIFVMMVPYCMIHFGKPMLETFGAIGAGVALGFMSLKTRSIWLGAALHVGVAISMDVLSLWRKGLL